MKRRRAIVPLWLAAGLAVVLLGACRPRATYYNYQAVDAEGWMCTDTLRFVYDRLPEDSLCHMSIGLRCTNRLAMQDLWLVMEERTALDERHRDTVHVVLSDDKGEWQGQGNILHEYEQAVATGSYSKRQMPIELLVYHVMRDQCLTGIREIGVTIQ